MRSLHNFPTDKAKFKQELGQGKEQEEEEQSFDGS